MADAPKATEARLHPCDFFDEGLIPGMPMEYRLACLLAEKGIQLVSPLTMKAAPVPPWTAWLDPRTQEIVVRQGRVR